MELEGKIALVTGLNAEFNDAFYLKESQPFVGSQAVWFSAKPSFIRFL